MKKYPSIHRANKANRVYTINKRAELELIHVVDVFLEALKVSNCLHFVTVS